MERPEIWIQTYNRIKMRCENPNQPYFKKGRKCLITIEELKTLWFRDKGFNLSRPSIDRINNNGDYTFKNCRFIELKENIRLGNLNRKTSLKQSKSSAKNIQEANKNNLYYRRKVSNPKKIFNSMTEAAQYYSICVSAIHNCCNGISKKCNGMEWKYAN